MFFLLPAVFRSLFPPFPILILVPPVIFAFGGISPPSAPPFPAGCPPKMPLFKKCGRESIFVSLHSQGMRVTWLDLALSVEDIPTLLLISVLQRDSSH